MDSIESRQNLERFRELVLENPRLHDLLRSTPDHEAFVERAVELGREHDCLFTAETVRAAIQEQRRARFERWV